LFIGMRLRRCFVSAIFVTPFGELFDGRRLPLYHAHTHLIRQKN
jgi:hypothetical protein